MSIDSVSLLVDINIDAFTHSSTTMRVSCTGQQFDAYGVCSHTECCCVQIVSSGTVFSHDIIAMIGTSDQPCGWPKLVKFQFQFLFFFVFNGCFCVQIGPSITVFGPAVTCQQSSAAIVNAAVCRQCPWSFSHRECCCLQIMSIATVNAGWMQIVSSTIVNAVCR